MDIFPATFYNQIMLLLKGEIKGVLINTIANLLAVVGALSSPASAPPSAWEISGCFQPECPFTEAALS